MARRERGSSVDQYPLLGFFQETAAATRLCRKETLEVDRPVIRINDTTYAIEGGVSATLRCPEKAPQFKKTTEVTLFSVERGCSLSSERFIVTPGLQAKEETIEVAHSIHLPDVRLLIPEAEDMPPELNLEAGSTDFFQDEDDLDDDEGWSEEEDDPVWV